MENAEVISRQIFCASLQAAAPGAAVRQQVEHLRACYRVCGCQRLLIIGFG